MDTECVATRVREGLIHVDGNTELTLDCGVYLKDGAPRWDVRRIRFATGSGIDNDYCTLYRWTKPTASLPDEMKNKWTSVVLGRRHPFSGSVYADAGSTSIGILHPAFLSNGTVRVTKDFVYTLFATREGTVPPAKMKGYIEAFARETRIRQ